MDSLNRYRALVKQILTEYEQLYCMSREKNVEIYCVFDEAHDHYMLVEYGWAGQKRVKRTWLYVRLKSGKFWIEEDRTEEGIATDLLRADVPNEDIVLAFHAPEMRPYTEFAAA